VRLPRAEVAVPLIETPDHFQAAQIATLEGK